MNPPLTPAAWLRMDAIRRGLRSSRPHRILEVGAGEGAMAWRLAKWYDYVGLEPDSTSYATAANRLAALGRGRVAAATTCELDNDQFTNAYDLVCAFEVLEHLSDDVGELARWHRLLRADGFVLVSVPAHRHRFGPADKAVGHVRRYDRLNLENTLVQAGFEPLWVEAWGAGLGHLLEWLRNRMARRMSITSEANATARSGRWLQPRRLITGAVAAVVAAPFRLLQHPLRRSAFGIGWVALARRRGSERP